MKRLILALVFSLLSIPAWGADTPATEAARAVLEAQRLAWNRGDIEGFMNGYQHSDDIRFAGGDRFTYGWQSALDGYKRSYPDAKAMGKLDFTLVEVREMSPVAVYVFGQWHLTRIDEPADKAPHGVFTLILEKKDGLWGVTRDHTSSAGN